MENATKEFKSRKWSEYRIFDISSTFIVLLRLVVFDCNKSTNIEPTTANCERKKAEVSKFILKGIHSINSCISQTVFYITAHTEIPYLLNSKASNDAVLQSVGYTHFS